MGLGRDENRKGGVWWGWEGDENRKGGVWRGWEGDENIKGGVWWGWEEIRIEREGFGGVGKG